MMFDVYCLVCLYVCFVDLISYIWSIDDRELNRDEEVAALTDKDNVPPLWILAGVLQFRPGPVSAQNLISSCKFYKHWVLSLCLHFPAVCSLNV